MSESLELVVDSLFLVCSQCGRRQCVASGAIAHNVSCESVAASAEKLDWQVDPTLCWQCLGNPEPQTKQGKDQG